MGDEQLYPEGSRMEDTSGFRYIVRKNVLMIIS